MFTTAKRTYTSAKRTYNNAKRTFTNGEHRFYLLNGILSYSFFINGLHILCFFHIFAK